MEVGGEEVGRITFELRADVAPKTAENFVSRNLVTFDQQQQSSYNSYLSPPSCSVHCVLVRWDLDTKEALSIGTKAIPLNSPHVKICLSLPR